MKDTDVPEEDQKSTGRKILKWSIFVLLVAVLGYGIFMASTTKSSVDYDLEDRTPPTMENGECVEITDTPADVTRYRCSPYLPIPDRNITAPFTAIVITYDAPETGLGDFNVTD